MIQMKRFEEMILCSDLDYCGIKGLSDEEVEKLRRIKPRTLGQASRISGVNPSGIQAIMVYLRGKGRRSDGSDEKLAKTGAKALEILWRVNEWFPELSLEQRALFKKYHEELLRFNSSLNLIGVGTIANSDLVHFSDSIMACRECGCRRRLGSLYDFGSEMVFRV